jgi:hypothetical protein
VREAFLSECISDKNKLYDFFHRLSEPQKKKWTSQGIVEMMVMALGETC